MTWRPLAVWLSITLAALVMDACGGGSGALSTPSASNGSGNVDPFTGIPSGRLTLRASPIDPNAILWITPLGNLNPPQHALPTDHIYFYFANPDAGDSPVARRTAFMSPGDGTVMDVFGGGAGSDSKIYIRATTTFAYYIDHLIPSTSLSRGMKLTAGQVLGTTGSAYAIDLGVVNDTLTLTGFVNPSRYFNDTLHADGPLKYVEEPLRSRLYAKVQRLGSDLDGKIDLDIAGRLAGNWFADDSTPLAFVYDTYNPAKVLISVGSSTSPNVYAIAATDPLPRDVSVASGKVLYTLTRSISGPNANTSGIAGRMLVQMIDDTHIREELFASSASAADFTGTARTFAR